MDTPDTPQDEHDRLQTTIADLTAKLEEKTAKLDALQNALQGLDPTQVSQLLDRAKQWENQETQRKTELDLLKRQLEDQWRDAIKGKDTEIETLKQSLTQRDRDSALSSLFSKNAGLRFDAFKALLNLNAQITYSDNGQIEAIADLQGQPFKDEKDGHPLNLEEALIAMRRGKIGGDPMASCFTPWNQSQGSGYTGSNKTKIDSKNITLTEITRLYQTDPEQAKQLQTEFMKRKFGAS